MAVANKVVRYVDSRVTWARLDRKLPNGPVSSGPFLGMRIGDVTTGSHLPKRLGSYEFELQPLISEIGPYETVIDVGCGEGWYVVGLARLWPGCSVFGFDTSAEAQAACRSNAVLNGVTVSVGGTLTSSELASRLRPGTLLIVDIEGAELDLIDDEVLAALDGVDVLIETHDFARPSATELIKQRLGGRSIIQIDQQPRDPGNFPIPSSLTSREIHKALGESRPVDQHWIWSPAA